jgi:hypothetical protein
MYDNYQFAIYSPNCDAVEVNMANNIVLVIPCSAYNAAVTFENVNDIVYLYRLAEEAPLYLCQTCYARKRSSRLCRCYNLI